MSTLHKVEKVWLERLEKAVKKPKAEKPFMDLKGLNEINKDTYYGDKTREMMQALKRKSFRVKPEDQEKIANGRNVWLLNALSRRGDTDKGVINNILSSTGDFGSHAPVLMNNGESTYGRNKGNDAKKEMYDNFIGQLTGQHGESRDSVIKKLLHGPSHDVQRHIAQHVLTGEELLNHISDREHPMQGGAAAGILNNSNFGPEHTDEIMGHGNPEQVKALVAGKKLEPHQYELLFSNPNPEVRDAAIRKVASSYTYGNELPNLPTPVVVRAMQEHPDKDVQAGLYSRYSDRPEVAHAAWNMMPQSEKMANQIIHNHEGFTPEMGQAILNAHGNNESIVKDLSNKEDVLPTEMVRHILQNPQYSDQTKNRWLKHDHLTPQDLLPFAQSSDIDTVRRAMEHPNADETVVQAAHDKANAHTIGGDQGWENRRWQEIKDKALQHPKAPTSLAGNLAMMSEAAQIKAASYAHNLSPDQMTKLAASPHVKVREAMAQRDSTPDEIRQTLRNDKQAAVRKAYQWHKMRHGGATPEDWKSFVSDKAGTIRENALKSRDIPEEAVRLAAKHKDEGTRGLAMLHPNVPADLVNAAAQDTDPGVRMTAWSSGKLSPENAMNVYRNLGTDEDRKKFLLTSSENGRRGTSRAQPVAVPKEALDDVIARGHGEDAARYAMHSLDADHVSRIYDQLRDSGSWDTANVKNKMIEKAKSVHPELLDRVLADNNRPKPEGRDDYDHNQMKVPTHAILKRPELGDQHLLQITNTPDPDRNLNYHDWEAMAENPKTASLPAVKDFIKHNNIGAYRHFIEKNPGVNEAHLREAYNNDDADLRHEVVKHPGVPQDLIRAAMKDPHPMVAKTAGEQVALHMPDEYNATLPDAHTVDVHPAVEKLKHLKGLIEDQPGRSIAKRDLKAKLNIQEAPKEVLDPKGNITPESIDTAIKNLPKTRYNISYRHWKGAQMHDNTKPQLVMQMNLTNQQVDHLKKVGLYDTFRKVHDMSYRSGHPVQKHTLGWSRIDTQHPGHIHVDEVQSDLGQGTIRQILKAKEEGRMAGDEADKYVTDLKEINKYLAGGHKTINHAILSAVHQTARERGVPAVRNGNEERHENGVKVETGVPAQKEIKSTSMDTLQDQAKQSGQQTGGSKDLPVHMQQTYEEFPKAMGYAEKPKKEVMPATNSKEPTVNYRKLTKSMVDAVAAMAFLAKSGFTGGWASSRPDRPKPAGNMLPSGERHGTSPSVHIRADTMTHMDYDTSEETKPLAKTEQGESSLHPMGDDKDPTGSIRASTKGNLQDAVDVLEKSKPTKKFGNLRHMIDKAKLLASKESTHKPDEQPRNEKGQFEAWDEAAAVAHESTPDDYDPYADEDIWGKKPADPKLKKAIEGLSRIAQKIKQQTEGQVQGHGQIIPTRFPATAKPENLYASYKQNPHNPIASVLKYGIHRIENADRYDTPEGAEQADNEFVNSRDRAMTLARIPRDKRGNQHSIQELHNIMLKAPHLIDGLIQHQNAIHAHLKGTSKTKTIDGEPHVALTRGLGTGSRQKDPMLASYADSHEQTLGGRITKMHNHWVPLKNVWYSYDHGPRESHPQRYFPAQDEFLVSPHELKNAMSTDVKKLVPRKPKLDAGSAKPATTMPDMPDSASDTTVRGQP